MHTAATPQFRYQSRAYWGSAAKVQQPCGCTVHAAVGAALTAAVPQSRYQSRDYSAAKVRQPCGCTVHAAGALLLAFVQRTAFGSCHVYVARFLCRMRVYTAPAQRTPSLYSECWLSTGCPVFLALLTHHVGMVPPAVGFGMPCWAGCHWCGSRRRSFVCDCGLPGPVLEGLLSGPLCTQTPVCSVSSLREYEGRVPPVSRADTRRMGDTGIQPPPPPVVLSL